MNTLETLVKTEAVALGISKDEFADHLKSHATVEHVKEDFNSGVRSGVNGTPTFFINGVRHDNSWDEETALHNAAKSA